MFLDNVHVELEANCAAVDVALCAGQSTDIGTVTVENDDTNLYVTFNTTAPWYIDETHVAVGSSLDEIPQTKKGNPIPGQFPYECETLDPMATTCTAIIPLNGWCTGDEIFVAAHAAVSQIFGDGCDTVYLTTEVVDQAQGVRKDLSSVLPERSDPTAVFAFKGPFYSLGLDMFDVNAGWLTVGFDYPVYNGPGDDIVIQEITNGRPSYPVERAEVFGVEDGTDYYAGVVTNKDGGDGRGAVSLPDDITTVEAVKLLDDTDPTIHEDNADGYDVDAIGACWLYGGDETAWGAACDGNGTRFVDRGNWGTYFKYTITPCAGECSGD
jgi:hypothetical protein